MTQIYYLYHRCVPQAGIEPTFSRPQRDALTTGLSGPRFCEKRCSTYPRSTLLKNIRSRICSTNRITPQKVSGSYFTPSRSCTDQSIRLQSALHSHTWRVHWVIITSVIAFPTAGSHELLQLVKLYSKLIKYTLTTVTFVRNTHFQFGHVKRIK